MIVEPKQDGSEHMDRLRELLESAPVRFREVCTRSYGCFVCDSQVEITPQFLEQLRELAVISKFDDPFQLVSSSWRSHATAVTLDDGESIRSNDMTLVLGPCSVESEEQIVSVLKLLKEQNIRFVRGGVFKPRTSPYSFSGLGASALEMFAHHARSLGIKVVSEVISPRQIAEMHDHIDIFQVGARNSQNYPLLTELGQCGKPVLLKRALSGTLEEFLLSAEHLFVSGNESIILCERGIRTFENAYRNTLDLNAVAWLRRRSSLPVFVDPSHGTGARELVTPMSLAAILAGASGLLVEIHHDPDSALSDGQQSLDFSQAVDLIEQAHRTHALRKTLTVENN